MIKELKNIFFQTFTGTVIWVSFILTIFFKEFEPIGIWNIIGISLISALLFGIMYNALWNYFTLKPIWNIIIASIFNTLGGYTSLRLISKEVFNFMLNWTVGVFILTIVIHTAAFYFYGKYETKKNVEKLNGIVKQKNK